MIDIQATNFQRGDAVVLPTYGEPLGISGKWAEYDFSIAEEGSYVLSVRYATGEIRAVSVFLDGNLITDDGMANTTGGYESAKGVWEADQEPHLSDWTRGGCGGTVRAWARAEQPWTTRRWRRSENCWLPSRRCRAPS
jgi:hypothetical protein